MKEKPQEKRLWQEPELIAFATDTLGILRTPATGKFSGTIETTHITGIGVPSSRQIYIGPDTT